LRYAGIENPKYSRWTVDNQAQADFSTGDIRHTLLIGVDWQRQQTSDPQAYILTTPLDLYGGTDYGPVDPSQFTPDTWSYSHQSSRQTGLYLQDQLHFDDHWVLTTLGGRYDWARSETHDWSISSESRARTRDEAFSGRVGLVYLADNGLAPYLSYSEGFTPNAGTDFDGKPFDPTEAKQYEAGIKYQPPGSNSSVTAAVFEITQTTC
jgi:Outer membrane receptor proteins, mostly Fe transport